MNPQFGMQEISCWIPNQKRHSSAKFNVVKSHIDFIRLKLNMEKLDYISNVKSFCINDLHP